jgi:hypothetical protein
LPRIIENMLQCALGESDLFRMGFDLLVACSGTLGCRQKQSLHC